jgi:hypothetical protein
MKSKNLNGWSVIKNSANARVVAGSDEVRAFPRKSREIGVAAP